jgi:hypothetical protein
MLSRSGYGYGLLSLPPYLRLVERVTFTTEDSGFCRRTRIVGPALIEVRTPSRTVPPVLSSTRKN